MQKGDIVRALTGHDSGRLYVVLETGESGLLLCNGKQRKLRCPKRKNPRHIERLGASMLAERLERGLATDKEIRTTLAVFNAQEGTRLGKR